MPLPGRDACEGDTSHAGEQEPSRTGVLTLPQLEPLMSKDLRKYARQTNTRLIVGALALLFLVGDGLIYLLYGKSAAFMGLLCLLAGIIPIALTLIILALLNWISTHADRD